MPAAGDPVAATDITTLQSYTTLRPIVRMVQSVAQTAIASGTITACTFTTEDVDSNGFHDNVTNNSRITPNVAGWYRFHGAVAFTGQTDYTVVQAYLRVNGGGSGTAPGTRVAAITASSQSLVVQCDAMISVNGSTDYVELMFTHVRAGAGTSSTVISAQFATVFECEFLRPA